MCTSVCPCTYNVNFNLWNETLLENNNRTNNPALVIAGYVLMHAAASSTATPQYDTFWDCY